MNYAIIAAGEGSRLVQEGVKLPKPLVRLNGEPMIGRLIDIFMANEPESLSVIVNEQMTEVRDYLESRRDTLPVELHLCVKSTPSSMHSFYEVSRAMEGTPAGSKFCLTTVDTIFRPEAFAEYIKAFAADTRADGYMAVSAFVDDEKPLWVATDEAMRITAFCDSRNADTRYVSGGIYGLTAPALRVLHECLEQGMSRMRNYQRALVSAGLNLRAWPMGKIVDVDHAGDIEMAQAFLNSDPRNDLNNA